MSQARFGFQQVDEREKVDKVVDVFHSVAGKYDMMNGPTSGGPRYVQKVFTIVQTTARPDYKALDIAGGMGDLVKTFAHQASPTGKVWLADISESVLRVGRGRLLDTGMLALAVLYDAEHIPFPNAYFDMMIAAFGLRNMTRRDRIFAEMRRVAKPGDKAMVLEFSKVWQPLERACDVYSFKVLPWLGNKVIGDPESYRYLAESIRVYPDQGTLKQMTEQTELDSAECLSLTAGVTALHVDRRLQVFS